jgi:threonine/homoserine/homoserine lactone efflux protein
MTGIDLGMVLVMAITASGVTGLVLALPGAAPVVTVLAALYFVYLAWCIATAPPLADDADGRREPSFTAGVLLSLINPKGYAAMAALFSGCVLIKAALDAAQALVLLAVIVAVNAAWLVSAPRSRFFRIRTNRVINVTFASCWSPREGLALMV